MGSGFSSVLLVDSYVSRQFPRFRAKNRRTFAPFTMSFLQLLTLVGTVCLLQKYTSRPEANFFAGLHGVVIE